MTAKNAAPEVMAETPPRDFGSFYRATVAPLRRYLARIVRSDDDAQDLAHDAYRRVFSAMESKDIRQPQAFLYTTARRLAFKQLHRRHIAPVRPVGEKVIERAPSLSPGVERLVMARQEWARVEAAIAALPGGCRAVLELSHRDGLSHPEIAARLGIAISTVEKQHARALRLIRAQVDDEAPGAQPGKDNLEGDGSAAAT